MDQLGLEALQINHSVLKGDYDCNAMRIWTTSLQSQKSVAKEFWMTRMQQRILKIQGSGVKNFARTGKKA